jgi:hypothetical protein
LKIVSGVAALSLIRDFQKPKGRPEKNCTGQGFRNEMNVFEEAEHVKEAKFNAELADAPEMA